MILLTHLVSQPFLRVFTKSPTTIIQSILHILFFPTPFRVLSEASSTVSLYVYHLQIHFNSFRRLHVHADGGTSKTAPDVENPALLKGFLRGCQDIKAERFWSGSCL